MKKENISALARVLRISRQKLSRHLNKGHAPQPDACGLYDVAEVKEFLHTEQKTSKGYSGGNLLRARIEKLNLECRYLRERLKLDKPSIPVDDLADILFHYMNEHHRALMGATNGAVLQLVDLHDPRDVLAVMDAVIAQAENDVLRWCADNAIKTKDAPAIPWTLDHPALSVPKKARAKA